MCQPPQMAAGVDEKAMQRKVMAKLLNSSLKHQKVHLRTQLLCGLAQKLLGLWKSRNLCEEIVGRISENLEIETKLFCLFYVEKLSNC